MAAARRLRGRGGPPCPPEPAPSVPSDPYVLRARRPGRARCTPGRTPPPLQPSFPRRRRARRARGIHSAASWRGTLRRALAPAKNGTVGRDKARPSRVVLAAIPTPAFVAAIAATAPCARHNNRHSCAPFVRGAHVHLRVRPKRPHPSHKTYTSYAPGVPVGRVAHRAGCPSSSPHPTPNSLKSLLTCSIDTHRTV